MNISQIKRKLDDAGIWYSVLVQNDEIDIEEVTTVPHLCTDMHRKLFVLTSSNARVAEDAVQDWNAFANVIIDSGSTKLLRKLTPINLLIVGTTDLGQVIGLLNEATRR